MRKKKKRSPARRSPAIRPPVAKKKKKTREPPVVDELANEEESENELQTCLGNPVGFDNEKCQHCGQWMEEFGGVYVCLSC